MPGIEFVGADADDPAEEDLLETGPRRPWPRWVWLLAGLLALAAIVGVVVSTRSDDAPVAAPTPSTSTSPSVSPGPVEQITALTSDGTSLFWLAGTRLYRAGPVGRANRSAAVAAVADEFVQTPLVADPAERTVWRVYRGSNDYSGDPGTVEGFSTTHLDRTTRLSAPALIDGAVVFRKALYVLSRGHLLRATAGARRFVTVARVDAHARDPIATRTGLLFVAGINGSALGRWSPAGGVRPPVVLTSTDNSLAAAGAAVFLIGRRDRRVVLDRLSAAGRVVRRDILSGQSNDPRWVAQGTQSALAIGTGAAGLQLACVGVPRPSEVGAYQGVSFATATSANVAVLRHIVFQAVGDSVQPVLFAGSGCAG